ncbi:GntR family transcriptional regulator [Sinorhizobium meliloti]|uniref:GntR family transcriptional regulator n=1 Tax=Rhizobium meliloti TaxID=382 RepID=UPI0001E4B18D|nr:GntR family transcriptional regulator [Sinorhizobium meliloti]AEG58062.1 transcriptional regulator, GntR family [Sinorhizobium meliloti AK83]MDE4589031.1 GntR family transcriptional regulator [Sinorhizobium meliloti]SEJ80515.1 DNA-binding transcriptional regulator, GntR family [Sinorhizobium meliloti]
MTNEMSIETGYRSLAESVAARIRELLIAGEFAPGQKLSEHQIAAQFGISRNTLREVFRLLTSQRLLAYMPNRGVFVVSPDEAAVLDIYRVRSIIQKGAIQAANKGHPALVRMRQLAEQGEKASFDGNWRQVGTINLEFHRAMVELCDSPRLCSVFDLLLAELRLVFGQLDDGAHLHEPYVGLNTGLVGLLESGDIPAAVSQLEAYLLKSERAVLAALQRGRR